MVDRFDHILSRDHTSTEPAPVETTNCVLTALCTVEFDEDLAFVVLKTETDVDDFAILVVAFCFDVVGQFFLPAVLGFTEHMLSGLHDIVQSG